MRELQLAPSALQNPEAPLRDFGLNNHFPIVGKWLLSHSFLIILGLEILRAVLTAHPTPSRKREGLF
jgi:hypothetical protein